MTIDEAMAKFIEEWNQIPPLARAATAGAEADHHHRQAESAISAAMSQGLMKLPRRAAVCLRMSLMHSTFRDFMIELARSADEEAVEAGVDVQVAGVPQDDLLERAQKAIDKVRPMQFGLAASMWRGTGEEPDA